MADAPTTGALLRAYLAATALGAPLARRLLARRLARGKEDPARMAEKRGIASLPRPPGPLAWLHAVGVGEVLALPALAAALMDQHPDLAVLVTSSSRTSAEALAPNLPVGAIHQLLPLDIRPWRRRFLDHWRPDLSVWAERDLWPGLIADCDRRRIPLALVNARVDAASFAEKSRAKDLYRDLLSRFALVEAQDAESARHLAALGANAPQVTGSLKTAAAPLADRPGPRAELERLFAGRPLWLAASTHPDEEPILAEAHRRRLGDEPNAVLIVAPRDPHRAAATAETLRAAGIDTTVLPTTNIPERPAQAHVVAQIGQLGLWYRLAPVAFVGGSLDATGGHNPWEPARLDAAILHGPNVANFAQDYAALDAAGAARLAPNSEAIAAALADPATRDMAPRAAALAAQNARLPAEMAARLLALMETS